MKTWGVRVRRSFRLQRVTADAGAVGAAGELKFWLNVEDLTGAIAGTRAEVVRTFAPGYWLDVFPVLTDAK